MESKANSVKANIISSPKSWSFSLSVEEVFRHLNSSQKGLSTSQAEERLHKYGFNELPTAKKFKPIILFLQQFSSSLVLILIVAIVISLFLKENTDATVISFIVMMNALLGFFQEHRAEKELEALRKMASLQTVVLRDEREVLLDSKYLVPGDVIILKTGDKIPADCRLIEVHDLQTQEASLTGESQSITKDTKALLYSTSLADRKNSVYMTTIVSNGRGKAIVTATGLQTEVGQIAHLIKETVQKITPLQKKLQELGKYLSIIVVCIAIIVFIAGLITGLEVTSLTLTAVALAVAAIPEGLPAIITISLAHGAQRMARRKALIRKIPSVETLGSVNVICTDKTGTLTHNEMTVTKIWANDLVYSVTGSGYERKGLFLNEKKEAAPEELELLLKTGLLCNDAVIESGAEVKVIGDPSEAALLISAAKAGLNRHKLEQGFPRVDEISFTSERKMMTTIHKANKNLISYSKGAPDVIIDLCNRIFVNGKVYRLDAKKKKEILEYNELFASKALRVFGFAYRPETVRKDDAEKDMIFIGLQAMIDPPRQEVKEAIQKCKDAGIRVIMVTGDHLSTAKAIAEQLNITGKAITGKEIDALPNIDREIERINIFARVNPEHKLRIVNLLMQKGYVVAVTGDGINDAPALKKADIGVAMGITGTDVAKEASDLILTDDNFTSIVNAVEEGRGIYDNIGKFVKYLLSSNLAEILVIFLGMVILAPLAGLGLPLSPIHLLWINVVTDGLPAVALSMDPYAKDIMKRKPRDPKEHIITRKMASNIIQLGVIMALATLALFWLYRDSVKAQTMAFTALVVFELVRLYLVRSQNHTPLLSNKLLVFSVILSLGSQIAIMYVPFLMNIFDVAPLEFLDWVWILSAAAVMIIVTGITNRLHESSSTV